MKKCLVKSCHCDARSSDLENGYIAGYIAENCCTVYLLTNDQLSGVTQEIEMGRSLAGGQDSGGAAAGRRRVRGSGGSLGNMAALKPSFRARESCGAGSSAPGTWTWLLPVCCTVPAAPRPGLAPVISVDGAAKCGE